MRPAIIFCLFLVFFLQSMAAIPSEAAVKRSKKAAAPAATMSAAASKYFNKAISLYITGNMEGALADVRAAIKLNPKHLGARQLEKSIIKEMGPLPSKPSIRVPPPAPPKPVVSPAEYRMVSYLWLIGLLAIGALLSAAAVMLERSLIKKFRKEEELVCFQCGMRLMPSEETCPNCGANVGLKTWTAISDEQKSWYKKCGWKKNPFSLDIHPELFIGYKKEVKEVLEKISASSGHVLITGPLGIGKTTMLRWLAASLKMKTQFNAIYIPRPPVQFEQLLRFIVASLGLKVEGNPDFYDIYKLEELRKKIGKGLVLFLDEAHEFTVEVEKPLRTLGDMGRVSLVLAGLPETVKKLQKEIRPFYERLVLSTTLKPMEFAEIKELIQVRIENAGGMGTHPFTAAALTKVYELSGGNPRTTLKLCDAATTRAINLGEANIDVGVVEGIKHDADIDIA